MSVRSCKLVIFGDPAKGATGSVIDSFKRSVAGKAEVIGECGIRNCTLETLRDADFALVFGGDGSIISVARQLSESEVPVIGVNLGKLGFLAEFSLAEVESYFDDIIAGKLSIERRMVLGCSVEGADGEIFRSKAINEVFITSGPPFRMIELSIRVDGQSLAGCLSDGLIVATPTGSTAYNLSAGGPILSGNMEALVITAICPHTLTFRPIVINANSKIEISPVVVNEGTTVSVDGQVSLGLGMGQKVCLERESGSFLIVNNPKRTYWETLGSKLRWAQPPRYRQCKENKFPKSGYF
jgi:NAD+ kinase